MIEILIERIINHTNKESQKKIEDQEKKESQKNKKNQEIREKKNNNKEEKVNNKIIEIMGKEIMDRETMVKEINNKNLHQFMLEIWISALTSNNFKKYLDNVVKFKILELFMIEIVEEAKVLDS